jgi:nicotinate-nucleotide pyrophosphorylase (carboxylating)
VARPLDDPRFFDWILAEDLGEGDVTTEALVAADASTVADVVSKADGVVCGLGVFLPLVRRLDPDARVEPAAVDGDRVRTGQRLLTVRGRARAVLSTERTALNVARRASGIATLTARFVEAVRGLPVDVYDTRKTTPGWRDLEKHAVRCGGGENHRLRLGDAAMLKENHLLCAFGRTGPDAIREGVRRLRATLPAGFPVCVEVEDLAELDAALEEPVDVVMLDGFALNDLARAVATVRARPRPRPAVEATGNVTLDVVRAIAETGVDRVSVGALTHSAPAFDLSMRHRGAGEPR